MAEPIVVEGFYFDARRQSFEDVEETCPRMSQAQGSILRFCLKIISAECPDRLGYYRELIRNRLTDEFHELKEETTYKLRDALIDAHLRRLKLQDVCNNQKKEIQNLENTLAELFARTYDADPSGQLFGITYQSVTEAAASRGSSNVTGHLLKAPSRLRVALTCVKIILTRFHLWASMFVSGTTKPTKKTNEPG